MRPTGVMICLWMLGLAGCQCCGLTEDYACMVDAISDHEHTYERFYSPGWDLNRIGRPDWCSYTKNRLLCGRACDRCKPMPCGDARHIGQVVTTEQFSNPDWSDDGPPLVPPSTQDVPASDERSQNPD